MPIRHRILTMLVFLVALSGAAHAENRPPVHEGLPGDRAETVRVNRGPALPPPASSTERPDPTALPVRVETLPLARPVAAPRPMRLIHAGHKVPHWRLHPKRGHAGIHLYVRTDGIRAKLALGHSGKRKHKVYRHRARDRFVRDLLAARLPVYRRLAYQRGFAIGGLYK